MSTTRDTGGATALLDPPGWDAPNPQGSNVGENVGDDEFALDVRVVVALAPVGLAFCSTDDGCGNTCSGNASTCNSFVDDPA